MRVLITGITGFVGRHLASHLEMTGHEVAGLVRPGNEHGTAQAFPYDGSYRSVDYAVNTVRPDAIVHLATNYGHGVMPVEASLVSTNVTLPVFLHQAAKKCKAKVVSAGTYWQFGGQGDTVPLDLYSATKAAADVVAEYYALREDVWSAVLYLYGTFGGGDERGKILDRIMRAAATGAELRLSPGDQVLNLVDIYDVVDAFEKLLANPDLDRGVLHRFGVYSKESYSLKEIVAICRKYCGSEIRALFGAVPYRENELMLPRYPYTPVPGWVDQFPLERYVASYFAKYPVDRCGSGD